MSHRRPNILYLHCHDAGRYVQPYYPSIATPNIQRLAEQGVLFRQAFCLNPTCSPSRACLHTGQWAHCNGMLGLSHRGFRLKDYRQTLAHHLAENGYQTLLSGAQHIASEPFTKVEETGYTQILTRAGDFHEPTAQAIRFLESRPTEPFFLDVGYGAPHRAGEGFSTLFPPDDSRYVRVPPTLPDTPETRADMALYQASARSTDACFGRVLHALDAAGLADRTLVICTTDHGIAFPFMKCNLTDHGIGVMLILRGPGGFTGGTVVDAMVTHLDLFPTICELAGTPHPPWLQGASLRPLLADPRAEIHGAIFAEVNYHAAYEPMRCVRTPRYKYIRHFDHRDKVVLPNCDNSPSKTLLHEAGWGDRERPEERLYDLVFDPQETNNLAGNPDYARVQADLRDRLEGWMHETGDPLVHGPVPAPDDAVVNDPDDYSPNSKLHSAKR